MDCDIHEFVIRRPQAGFIYAQSGDRRSRVRHYCRHRACIVAGVYIEGGRTHVYRIADKDPFRGSARQVYH